MVIGSIATWGHLERLFVAKYGQKKTLSTLVQDLSIMKVNPKETINDFNQRFMAVLNKLPQTSKPAQYILCGFYLTGLPTTIVAFIMNVEKL